MECPCCGGRINVRRGQVWKARGIDASLRILEVDKDGAIVEQVGREHLESRWGISYRDLLAQYRKEH